MNVQSFAPNTRRRAFAALAAVVCLGVGQVAEALHLAVEEHTVCAHGALVHVHVDHGTEHGHDEASDQVGDELRVTEATPTVELPETPGPWLASGADDGHHDHCDDVSPPASRADRFDPVVLNPQLTLRAALQDGQACPQCAPSCAVYITAPKASPPA